ncbi:hypothetical protein P3602_21460 [Vibrio parahaemolyticus]|nr:MULTISPECIES: hypothetical protein [Vibrio]MDF5108478.1 hypothetical protein [Vibrio parahaemolyticus]MCA2420857.1 hypothetical protein [Vibrio alginolyticus]MCA2445631.1 hypothetical protein [Vibrio alginolyticus]MDF5143383.1 hypothetical protein [Vibrio parahaemolyticus]MDF5153809.1 hypothetical protein [Vibrio parahaemolyticus]
MTPILTDVYSDEYFHLAEKPWLSGQENCPVFLEDKITCQGVCCFNIKTKKWDVELARGYGMVVIDSCETRDEGIALLWERRQEGNSWDIGI